MDEILVLIESVSKGGSYLHFKIDSAIFISIVYSLFPKELTIQNLFIFTVAGVVPCGGRKTSARTSL